MKRIRVSGTDFINEEGNSVLFNGICFICRERDKGYLEPGIESVLKAYGEKGFNLIRLGIFWDGVEPEPGTYDDTYLDRVAKVVEAAGEQGIYVFLDMHQDLYSSKFADGAPLWATLDEGLPHPDNGGVWYESYLSSPAVIRSADNFWDNKKAADGVGLLEHYEAMWLHIAERFKNYDNIIGFEPMNEPYMGSLAPKAFQMAVEKVRETNPDFDLSKAYAATEEEAAVIRGVLTEQFNGFDKETLMPFYQRMLEVIRKVTGLPLVTGANIYGTAVKTGIGRLEDSQQIYAPHGYDSVVDTDNYDAYNKDNVTGIFAGQKTVQEELQLPVIVGEWGNFPAGDYTGDLIRHMTGILEKYLWSSTYHQYVGGMEQDPHYNNLERGYPVETAGRLISYHYDYEKESLQVQWEGLPGGKMTAYIPNAASIKEEDIQVFVPAKIHLEAVGGCGGGYVTVITANAGKAILYVNYSQSL